jgi:hypothetical protein
MWSSAYANVQEGKVVIRLSLRGEVDVGMNAVQVVKEIIQPSWSMRPDHECRPRNGTNKWACRPACRLPPPQNSSRRSCKTQETAVSP